MTAASADALLDSVRSARISAADVAEHALAAAEDCRRQLNALTVVTHEAARAAAAATDRRHADGEYRPLDGLPIVVKDLIDTAGIETRYGSPAYAGHVPRRDAEVVRRLFAAGAVMVGKATTHEFAWGVTTTSDAYGATRNPHDPTRIAGGSSGGTAAAVAFGAVPVGLGTDTGGSVRIPAALCGVSGFKPTRGMWPLDGIFPLAPSLDHVGVIGRTVGDCRTLAGVLGLPPSQGRPGRAMAMAAPGGLRPEPGIARRFAAACERLSDLIDMVEPIAPPIPPDSYEAFAAIVLVEAAGVHFARTDAARRDRYGASVRHSLTLARDRTMGDYEAAQDARRSVAAALDAVFAAADVLLTPTTPIVAPPIGTEKVTADGRDVPIRHALMANTSPFNLTGHPAVTVPLPGIDGELPAGLQIVGRRGEDLRLLAFADAVVAALHPDA